MSNEFPVSEDPFDLMLRGQADLQADLLDEAFGADEGSFLRFSFDRLSVSLLRDKERFVADGTFYLRVFAEHFNLSLPEPHLVAINRENRAEILFTCLMAQIDRVAPCIALRHNIPIRDVLFSIIDDYFQQQFRADTLSESSVRSVLFWALGSKSPEAFPEVFSALKTKLTPSQKGSKLLAQWVCVDSSSELLLPELDEYLRVNLQFDQPQVQALNRYVFAHGSHDRINFLLKTLAQHKAPRTIFDDPALFNVVLERNDPAVLRCLLKAVKREQACQWVSDYLEEAFRERRITEPAVLKVLWPYLRSKAHRVAVDRAIKDAHRVKSNGGIKKAVLSALRLPFQLTLYALMLPIDLLYHGFAALFAWVTSNVAMREEVKRSFRENILLYHDAASLSDAARARCRIQNQAIRLGYKDAYRINYRTSDGVSLEGIKVVRDTALPPKKQKWVVYFSQIDAKISNELEQNLKFYAEHYPDSHILACDFRHKTERISRVWSQSAWRRDVEASVLYLRNRGVPAEQIEVVGDCLGSVMGARAVRRLHQSAHPVYFTSIRTPASFSGFLSNAWPIKMLLRGLMNLLNWEANARKAYEALPESHRKHVTVEDGVSTLNQRLQASGKVEASELSRARFAVPEGHQNTLAAHGLPFAKLTPPSDFSNNLSSFFCDRKSHQEDPLPTGTHASQSRCSSMMRVG